MNVPMRCKFCKRYFCKGLRHETEFSVEKIQLIHAAKELAALKLWEHFDNMDFFVVETPLEEPVVGCIMGAGREEFGVCIFRGPDAFEQPFLLEQSKDALSRKGNTLGFSMETYRDMQYEEKKWYKSANYRTHKDDWLPGFIVKQPGQHVECPEKDGDIKLLLYVIKGMILAHEKRQFKPATVGVQDGRLLTLQLSGPAEKPAVNVVHKAFAGSEELVEFCNRDLEAEPWTEPDLSDLPRRDETWVLATGYTSISKDADDICVLAVADAKTGMILHSDLLDMDIAWVIDMLAGVFNGDNIDERIGIPACLVIADIDLYRAVCGPLEKLGLHVRYEADHPVAADIRDSLQDRLPTLLADLMDRQSEDLEVDLGTVPEPDDLKGWKAASAAQTARFIRFWQTSDFLRKPRPSKQYFGDADWDYYIEEYDNLLPLPGYVTWAATSYRKQKKDKTFVETLLAEDTPAALGIALEAIGTSYPSLYQVEQTDAEAGTLVIKNFTIFLKFFKCLYILSLQNHCVSVFRSYRGFGL